MQTNTTPVPNVIFDIYMRDLKSAELKVLLVVIRQTLGWADRRGMFGRKEYDWISGSQVRQKTGCSSRAITSALEVLVHYRLIEIYDENFCLLDTPDKRKGKIKLYYRLSPYVNNTVENPVGILETTAKFAEDISKKVTALAQNMRITKETLQN